ncbi:putative HECT E3 ubiquitin ligase [Blattamonas nauphoetae]|uniref:HECT E3 ubiquitin ligase n=1 Tax=Blattamonas nauphoetae TaxID=2049346 RepID=A0ABQ9Y5V2_9EUKA|nr:putative HECT E3 ubiquitin ligase [Blattamonas nauphoetae]
MLVLNTQNQQFVQKKSFKGEIPKLSLTTFEHSSTISLSFCCTLIKALSHNNPTILPLCMQSLDQSLSKFPPLSLRNQPLTLFSELEELTLSLPKESIGNRLLQAIIFLQLAIITGRLRYSLQLISILRTLSPISQNESQTPDKSVTDSLNKLNSLINVFLSKTPLTSISPNIESFLQSQTLKFSPTSVPKLSSMDLSIVRSVSNGQYIFLLTKPGYLIQVGTGASGTVPEKVYNYAQTCTAEDMTITLQNPVSPDLLSLKDNRVAIAFHNSFLNPKSKPIMKVYDSRTLHHIEDVYSSFQATDDQSKTTIPVPPIHVIFSRLRHFSPKLQSNLDKERQNLSSAKLSTAEQPNEETDNPEKGQDWKNSSTQLLKDDEIYERCIPPTFLIPPQPSSDDISLHSNLSSLTFLTRFFSDEEHIFLLSVPENQTTKPNLVYYGVLLVFSAKTFSLLSQHLIDFSTFTAPAICSSCQISLKPSNASQCLQCSSDSGPTIFFCDECIRSGRTTINHHSLHTYSTYKQTKDTLFNTKDFLSNNFISNGQVLCTSSNAGPESRNFRYTTFALSHQITAELLSITGMAKECLYEDLSFAKASTGLTNNKGITGLFYPFAVDCSDKTIQLAKTLFAEFESLLLSKSTSDSDEQHSSLVSCLTNYSIFLSLVLQNFSFISGSSYTPESFGLDTDTQQSLVAHAERIRDQDSDQNTKQVQNTPTDDVVKQLRTKIGELTTSLVLKSIQLKGDENMMVRVISRLIQSNIPLEGQTEVAESTQVLSLPLNANNSSIHQFFVSFTKSLVQPLDQFIFSTIHTLVDSPPTSTEDSTSSPLETLLPFLLLSAEHESFVSFSSLFGTVTPLTNTPASKFLFSFARLLTAHFTTLIEEKNKQDLPLSAYDISFHPLFRSFVTFASMLLIIGDRHLKRIEFVLKEAQNETKTKLTKEHTDMVIQSLSNDLVYTSVRFVLSFIHLHAASHSLSQVLSKHTLQLEASLSTFISTFISAVSTPASSTSLTFSPFNHPSDFTSFIANPFNPVEISTHALINGYSNFTPDCTPVVVATNHPYSNNEKWHKLVAVPYATSYQLTFHESCKTESGCDYMSIWEVSLVDTQQRPGKRLYHWSGRDFQRKISINQRSFFIGFESDGSGTDWGFHVSIAPVIPVVVRSFGVVAEVDWLIGSVNSKFGEIALHPLKAGKRHTIDVLQKASELRRKGKIQPFTPTIHTDWSMTPIDPSDFLVPEPSEPAPAPTEEDEKKDTLPSAEWKGSGFRRSLLLDESSVTSGVLFKNGFEASFLRALRDHVGLTEDAVISEVLSATDKDICVALGKALGQTMNDEQMKTKKLFSVFESLLVPHHSTHNPLISFFISQKALPSLPPRAQPSLPTLLSHVFAAVLSIQSPSITSTLISLFTSLSSNPTASPQWTVSGEHEKTLLSAWKLTLDIVSQISRNAVGNGPAAFAVLSSELLLRAGLLVMRKESILFSETSEESGENINDALFTFLFQISSVQFIRTIFFQSATNTCRSVFLSALSDRFDDTDKQMMPLSAIQLGELESQFAASDDPLQIIRPVLSQTQNEKIQKLFVTIAKYIVRSAEMIEKDVVENNTQFVEHSTSFRSLLKLATRIFALAPSVGLLEQHNLLQTLKRILMIDLHSHSAVIDLKDAVLVVFKSLFSLFSNQTSFQTSEHSALAKTRVDLFSILRDVFVFSASAFINARLLSGRSVRRRVSDPLSKDPQHTLTSVTLPIPDNIAAHSLTLLAGVLRSHPEMINDTSIVTDHCINILVESMLFGSNIILSCAHSVVDQIVLLGRLSPTHIMTIQNIKIELLDVLMVTVFLVQHVIYRHLPRTLPHSSPTSTRFDAIMSVIDLVVLVSLFDITYRMEPRLHLSHPQSFFLWRTNVASSPALLDAMQREWQLSDEEMAKGKKWLAKTTKLTIENSKEMTVFEYKDGAIIETTQPIPDSIQQQTTSPSEETENLSSDHELYLFQTAFMNWFVAPLSLTRTHTLIQNGGQTEQLLISLLSKNETNTKTYPEWVTTINNRFKASILALPSVLSRTIPWLDKTKPRDEPISSTPFSIDDESYMAILDADASLRVLVGDQRDTLRVGSRVKHLITHKVGYVVSCSTNSLYAGVSFDTKPEQITNVPFQLLSVISQTAQYVPELVKDEKVIDTIFDLFNLQKDHGQIYQTMSKTPSLHHSTVYYLYSASLIFSSVRMNCLKFLQVTPLTPSLMNHQSAQSVFAQVLNMACLLSSGESDDATKQREVDITTVFVCTFFRFDHNEADASLKLENGEQLPSSTTPAVEQPSKPKVNINDTHLAEWENDFSSVGTTLLFSYCHRCKSLQAVKCDCGSPVLTRHQVRNNHFWCPTEQNWQLLSDRANCVCMNPPSDRKLSFFFAIINKNEWTHLLSSATADTDPMASLFFCPETSVLRLPFNGDTKLFVSDGDLVDNDGATFSLSVIKHPRLKIDPKDIWEYQMYKIGKREVGKPKKKKTKRDSDSDSESSSDIPPDDWCLARTGSHATPAEKTDAPRFSMQLANYDSPKWNVINCYVNYTFLNSIAPLPRHKLIASSVQETFQVSVEKQFLDLVRTINTESLPTPLDSQVSASKRIIPTVITTTRYTYPSLTPKDILEVKSIPSDTHPILHPAQVSMFIHLLNPKPRQRVLVVGFDPHSLSIPLAHFVRPFGFVIQTYTPDLDEVVEVETRTHGSQRFEWDAVTNEAFKEFSKLREKGRAGQYRPAYDHVQHRALHANHFMTQSNIFAMSPNLFEFDKIVFTNRCNPVHLLAAATLLSHKPDSAILYPDNQTSSMTLLTFNDKAMADGVKFQRVGLMNYRSHTLTLPSCVSDASEIWKTPEASADEAIHELMVPHHVLKIADMNESFTGQLNLQNPKPPDFGQAEYLYSAILCNQLHICTNNGGSFCGSYERGKDIIRQKEEQIRQNPTTWKETKLFSTSTLSRRDMEEYRLVSSHDGYVRQPIFMCHPCFGDGEGACTPCLIRCHTHTSSQEKQILKKRKEMGNSKGKLNREKRKFRNSRYFCDCGPSKFHGKLYTCNSKDAFSSVPTSILVAPSSLPKPANHPADLPFVGELMWLCPSEEIFAPHFLTTEEAQKLAKKDKKVVIAGIMTEELYAHLLGLPEPDAETTGFVFEESEAEKEASPSSSVDREKLSGLQMLMTSLAFRQQQDLLNRKFEPVQPKPVASPKEQTQKEKSPKVGEVKQETRPKRRPEPESDSDSIEEIATEGHYRLSQLNARSQHEPGTTSRPSATSGRDEKEEEDSGDDADNEEDEDDGQELTADQLRELAMLMQMMGQMGDLDDDDSSDFVHESDEEESSDGSKDEAFHRFGAGDQGLNGGSDSESDSDDSDDEDDSIFERIELPFRSPQDVSDSSDSDDSVIVQAEQSNRFNNIPIDWRNDLCYGEPLPFGLDDETIQPSALDQIISTNTGTDETPSLGDVVKPRLKQEELKQLKRLREAQRGKRQKGKEGPAEEDLISKYRNQKLLDLAHDDQSRPQQAAQAPGSGESSEEDEFDTLLAGTTADDDGKDASFKEAFRKWQEKKVRDPTTRPNRDESNSDSDSDESQEETSSSSSESTDDFFKDSTNDLVYKYLHSTSKTTSTVNSELAMLHATTLASPNGLAPIKAEDINGKDSYYLDPDYQPLTLLGSSPFKSSLRPISLLSYTSTHAQVHVFDTYHSHRYLLTVPISALRVATVKTSILETPNMSYSRNQEEGFDQDQYNQHIANFMLVQSAVHVTLAKSLAMKLLCPSDDTPKLNTSIASEKVTFKFISSIFKNIIFLIPQISEKRLSEQSLRQFTMSTPPPSSKSDSVESLLRFTRFVFQWIVGDLRSPQIGTEVLRLLSSDYAKTYEHQPIEKDSEKAWGTKSNTIGFIVRCLVQILSSPLRISQSLAQLESSSLSLLIPTSPSFTSINTKMTTSSLLASSSLLLSQQSPPDDVFYTYNIVSLSSNESTTDNSNFILFESSHPYPNDANNEFSINIPGANGIRIIFDRRCRTEKGPDCLTFIDAKTHKEIKKFTGHDGWISFDIPEVSSVIGKFRSDGSVNDWGYRFLAIAITSQSNQQAVQSWKSIQDQLTGTNERSGSKKSNETADFEFVMWALQLLLLLPLRIPQPPSSTPPPSPILAHLTLDLVGFINPLLAIVSSLNCGHPVFRLASNVLNDLLERWMECHNLDQLQTNTNTFGFPSESVQRSITTFVIDDDDISEDSDSDNDSDLDDGPDIALSVRNIITALEVKHSLIRSLRLHQRLTKIESEEFVPTPVHISTNTAHLPDTLFHLPSPLPFKEESIISKFDSLSSIFAHEMGAKHPLSLDLLTHLTQSAASTFILSSPHPYTKEGWEQEIVSPLKCTFNLAIAPTSKVNSGNGHTLTIVSKDGDTEKRLLISSFTQEFKVKGPYLKLILDTKNTEPEKNDSFGVDITVSVSFDKKKKKKSEKKDTATGKRQFNEMLIPTVRRLMNIFSDSSVWNTSLDSALVTLLNGVCKRTQKNWKDVSIQDILDEASVTMEGPNESFVKRAISLSTACPVGSCPSQKPDEEQSRIPSMTPTFPQFHPHSSDPTQQILELASDISTFSPFSHLPLQFSSLFESSKEEKPKEGLLIDPLTIHPLLIRLEMVKQFNVNLFNLLEILPFTSFSSSLHVLPQINSTRSLLFSTMKSTLFDTIINKSFTDSPRRPEINLNRTTRNMGNLVTHSIYFQAMNALRPHISSGSVKQRSQAFQVALTGEGSIDQGGPYREVLSDMTSELQEYVYVDKRGQVRGENDGGDKRMRMPLLRPTANGLSELGEERESFVLNTSNDEIEWTRGIPSSSTMSSFGQSSPETKRQLLTFLGSLMGIHILTHNPMNLNLSSTVWKQIVGQELTLADVRRTDEMAAKMIEITKRCEDREEWEDLEVVWEWMGVDGHLVDLRQFISDSDHALVDVEALSDNTARFAPISLTPSTPVPFTLRSVFSRALLAFKTTEGQSEAQLVRTGLLSLVSEELLLFSTGADLEFLVCGDDEMSVEDLKEVTEFRGEYRQPEKQNMYWQMIESMTNEERKRWLRFVTGRSKLPASVRQRKDSKEKREIIMKVDSMRPRNSVDRYLPLGHTCAQAVEIPLYSTLEIMKAKCVYAAMNCLSIETDGTGRGGYEIADEEE